MFFFTLNEIGKRNYAKKYWIELKFSSFLFWEAKILKQKILNRSKAKKAKKAIKAKKAKK
jgi:hypothetical protein